MLAHICNILSFRTLKKPSSTSLVSCYHNGNHITETNILLIITPFSEKDKSFTATIYKNWHNYQYPRFPLSGHQSLYPPIHNLAAFTIILSTPQKHMAHHKTTPNFPIYIHLNIFQFPVFSIWKSLQVLQKACIKIVAHIHTVLFCWKVKVSSVN